jgi:hypothetical protein
MRGPLLNLFILLSLGLFAQACGRPSHVEGAPRFVKGQITIKGSGVELSVDRRLTRTWKDYDGDGLADRLDADIDNDGVANLADQYPFDGAKWGEDSDKDGIADFIDLSVGHHKGLADLQQDIFARLGIVVMLGDDRFTDEEWQMLHATLFNEALLLKLRYDELAVIVRYSKEDQLGLARAEFDPYWKQISFFPNEDHLANALSFNGSLVHELGHVHAAENPAALDLFAEHFAGWASPSNYGATSPEEGYAENFLYELVVSGALSVDMRRFERTK